MAEVDTYPSQRQPVLASDSNVSPSTTAAEAFSTVRDHRVAHEESNIVHAEDGATANVDSTKKKTRIIRRKRRPARPQIDPSTIKSEPPPQTGTIFNIWYNKWSGGDREDKYLSKTHATGRCNIATDSGYTRADRIQGSYFCLFFARGLCPRGHECEYLHRLPGLHDHFNPNIDCFGRDKHSEYRDDMGGVGSFMRQNRTLYVGRIHVTDDIEEVVARHFAEWGEIERTRVLTGRGVAFVTYVNEANSQFAKEAMAHQSLDHNEILNVRWATLDPNPLAQKREVRRIEEQAAEAVRRALPEEFVKEIEGRTSQSTKRQKNEDTFGLQGYEAPDEILYAGAASIGAQGAQGLLRYNAEKSVETQTSFEEEKQADEGGLLSESALAAVRSLPAQPSNPQTGYSAGKLLVDYESDEDSE